MDAPIMLNVSPHDDPAICAEGPFGRSGTAIATRDALTRLLGPAHDCDIDDKVTVRWFLRTPRGLVCVRDYWWNRPGEWSLAGSRKATLWAAAYLRAHGITARQRGWHALQEDVRAGVIAA